MDFTIPTTSREKRRSAWEDKPPLDEQEDEQAGIKAPQSGLGQTSEGEEDEFQPTEQIITPRKGRESPINTNARLDMGGLNLSCGASGPNGDSVSQLESILCKVLRRGLEGPDREPTRALNDNRLPQIPVVTFDGSPEKYYDFLKHFEAHIEPYAQDKQQLLAQLIHHCVGDAKEAILGCNYYPASEGYDMAKRILEETYGQPEEVIDAIVEKLATGPELRSEKAGLENFVVKLRRLQTTMTQLSMARTMDTYHTITPLVRRLNKEMRGRWLDYAAQNVSRSGPQIEHFVKFMRTEINRAHCRYSKVCEEPGPSMRRIHMAAEDTVNTMQSESSSSGRPQLFKVSPCLMCKRAHHPDSCKEFLGIETEKRMKIVRQARACLRCLRTNDLANQFRVNRGCKLRLVVSYIPDVWFPNPYSPLSSCR